MNVTLEKKIPTTVEQKKVQRNCRRVTICRSCRGVCYKNQWYAPDSKLALLLDTKNDLVSYNTCSACEMQREGRYEGVLYVKDIPEDKYDRVVSTILHEATQDYVENPQHRLLEFSDIPDGYVVTATSAEMIHRLRRKVQSAFDVCKVYVSTLHPSYQK